jgi:hypothetical protein
MLKRLASLPLYDTSVKAKSTEILSDEDRNDPYRALALWAESMQLTNVPVYGKCEVTGKFAVVAPGIRIIGCGSMEGARLQLVGRQSCWSGVPLPDQPYIVPKLP